MVVDEDVLEKEDMYILDQMKNFIANAEVVRFAAAKQLMILIERAVSAVSWHTLRTQYGSLAKRRRHCEDHGDYSAGISAASYNSTNHQKVEITGHRTTGTGQATDNNGERTLPKDSTHGMSSAVTRAEERPQ